MLRNTEEFFFLELRLSAGQELHPPLIEHEISLPSHKSPLSVPILSQFNPSKLNDFYVVPTSATH